MPISQSTSRARVCPAGVLLAAVVWILSTAGVLAEAAAPVLGLPLACEPGRTCFIQSYVDTDPSAAARDFRCGSATYDGHKGVDFRVLSTAAARTGIAVLASAPGVVKGVRDSMPDELIREAGRASVTSRECGNGVVIDHGGGWETQYCHMRRGSVVVQRGARIERGQKLGEVGYSGLADFAHVHLSVRKDGKVVDPFTGEGTSDGCTPADRTSGSLWQATVLGQFPYANGEILGAGFADRRPTTLALERDHESIPSPGPRSDVFVFYARVINVRAGDRVVLRVRGPAGFLVESAGRPVARNQAQRVVFAGKKLRVPAWPSGRYEGQAELIRDGTVLDRASALLVLE